MKGVMQHQFAQVPNVDIPRSVFDRSFTHKTTFDVDTLIPVYADEVYPGDSFNVRMAGFARMSTPIYPIMDNLYLDTQFFAVPIRLIWDNFNKFLGEQDNPSDTIDYLLPTMDSPATVGHVQGSLSDYLGIPTDIPDLTHSSLWHRAYAKIFNDWYRDQNLIDSVTLDTDDGPDTSTDYTLQKRGKRHDYFTSCLPWPQKTAGTSEVTVPLGTEAPVTGIGWTTQGVTADQLYVTDATGISASQNANNIAGSNNLKAFEDASNTGFPDIRADLTNATAATINQWREAFQIQRLLEKDARGGTRLNEIIQSHFKVTVPDFRVQRSEFLGGGSTPINVTPVAQTAPTGVGIPDGLGDLGAYATSAINGHGFTKSFVEHSIILGIVSVRADLTYQQGLNRMFSRSTRYDMYWPSLANLGEQAVLRKEIYAQGSLAATDDEVFGYNERWSELRYKPSMITGQFRSTYSTPLDSWHLSQEFSTKPELNQAFIESNTPMSRVLATPTEPHFIFDSYFKMKCARPLPLYSVPGMIDHF